MQWKKILPIAGAFIVYQFYKLYEFGTSIIFKPTKYELKQIGTNSIVVSVTFQITNPQNRSLKVRGVDGLLSHEGNTLAVFNSGAFTIERGVSFFKMDLNINTANSFKYVNSLLAQGSNVAPFVLKTTLKLPYFSTSFTEEMPLRDFTKIVI